MELLYETKLKSYFKDDYDSFIEQFNEINSAGFNILIVGGNILSVISDFISNDIDIYINYRNVNSFKDYLEHIDYKVNEIITPKNDELFDKRHIIYKMICKKDKNIKIDLFVVENVIEVVSNNLLFDFLCISYDGNKIYFDSDYFNKDEITGLLSHNFKGKLTDLYIEDFIQMNNYIRKKIEKYNNRHFDIKFSVKELFPTGILTLKKQLITYENIFVKQIFHTIIKNNGNITITPLKSYDFETIRTYLKFYDINEKEIYLLSFSQKDFILNDVSMIQLKKFTGLTIKDIDIYKLEYNSCFELDHTNYNTDDFCLDFLEKIDDAEKNYIDKTYEENIEDVEDIEGIENINDIEGFGGGKEYCSRTEKIDDRECICKTKGINCVRYKFYNYCKNCDCNLSECDNNIIALKNIKVNENIIHPTVILGFHRISIKKYIKKYMKLKHIDNYLFIYKDNIISISFKLIKSTLINPENWFYKCNGNFIKKIDGTETEDKQYNNVIRYTYVRFRMDDRLYHIPYKKIIMFLKSKKLVVHMIQERKITHSISFFNAFKIAGLDPFGNHCQSNSSIIVYDLKFCVGENCKITKTFELVENLTDL